MITRHSDLAAAIAGKKILHLNSLGKDAVLCLDWLNNYAHCNVVSVFFKFDATFPGEEKYFEYLKKQYPRTRFLTEVSAVELTEKLQGMLQSPIFQNYVINHQDFDEFSQEKIAQELREKYECDYICSGFSKYEGMGRALYLRRVGLLNEKRKYIYPIGLMTQAQVYSLLKSIKTKLNPSYKYASESFDSASYFKMRSALICNKEYKAKMYKHYPMLALDEYRWEVLFGKR